MKRIERRSPFWSRLLAVLITFAIIAVLVFGGVKNVMGELSEAHDALAASQYALGKSQSELVAARSKLAETETELAGAIVENANMARAMREGHQQLQAANSKIVILNHAKDQLKQRWGYTLQALAQRNEQLVATDRALQAAQRELARLRNQPQWSVVVTSERQMRQGYRERFAMSQARMMVEGDGGFMYYEGMAAQHEIEEYFGYAERTQVVLTTTAPGQDVLRCMNDASLGCGKVLAVRAQAAKMEAYSYQSRYVSEEMLMIGARG